MKSIGEKQKAAENRLLLFGKIFCGLVFGLMVWNGWIVKPGGSDPFSLENLWEAVHPASVLNIIGLILLCSSILALTGFTKWLFGIWMQPEGSSSITNALFAGGFVGVILTFV